MQQAERKSSKITDDITQSEGGQVYCVIGGVTYYWVKEDHDVDY